LSAQAGPARPSPNTSTVDATITLRRVTIPLHPVNWIGSGPPTTAGGKLHPQSCGNDVAKAEWPEQASPSYSALA
jgi:hypothetical protein